MFKLQIFFIRCIFHPFLILFYFFFNLNPPSTLKRQQFHQVENSRTSAGPLQTSARLASVTRGTVEGVELQLHRGSNNGLSLHHKRSYPFNRAMPPFPARSRSGSSPALCKSFGGDAPDRGTRRVSRSVENRPSRASVLINGDGSRGDLIAAREEQRRSSHVVEELVSQEKNGGKNRSVRGRRIDEERKMATGARKETG